MSVHDDAAFVGEAVESVLGQTLGDLELLVVDDGSTDTTPDVLAGFTDSRVTVLRNDAVLGLATSLNRGLDTAQGRYVARLDADDVALPDRLARQVERLHARPAAAAVGTAVIDVDARGRRGRTHVMPRGARLLRWQALSGRRKQVMTGASDLATSIPGPICWEPWRSLSIRWIATALP